MSTKIKALGLGLFAALAIGAFGVISATAQTGGHFESEIEHTDVKGSEEGAHQLHFREEGAGLEQRIGCTNDSYTGTVTPKTVTEIVVTPSWSTCHTTTSGARTHFEVHENECTFRFTVSTTPEAHNNTVHLECPTSKGIEITHPNCNITVTPQTVDGVGYKTITENGKHAITMEVTADDITSEYHEKICVFLGTHHQSEMAGSVTVKGFEPETNNQVSITAT